MNENMKQPERIYLTGFMASGKTAVGRELARCLGWRFVDLDEEITVSTGRTIPELFADGEEVFRRAERQALERASETDQVVIALGGGAVAWEKTLDYIRECGLLVYLKVDSDLILERLISDDVERPLVTGYSGKGLRRRIDHLLQKRRPFYESAVVTIDCLRDRTPESLAEELLHAFR